MNFMTHCDLNISSRLSAWLRTGVRGPLAIFMVCLLLASTPLTSWAQFSRETDTTPQTMMGTQWMLMSLEQVSGIHSPGEGQLDAAAILMEEATALIPDDPQLWKHMASLQDQRGNQSGWSQAIRRYLKLKPSDDVALYDLLIYRASQEQTLNARQAYIERVLTQSPRGALSDPLQSRLAIYLALAAREQGDTSMMLHWLKQAVKLDSTNIAAAQLTFELLVENDAAPERLIQGLFRLLEASPGDPAVRLDMAERCFDEALYRRAAQQYDMAAQLSGGGLEPKMFEPWISCLLATGQPRAALRLLYDLEAMVRDANPQQNDLTQWPGDGEDQPEVELPVSTLLLWLIASPSDDMPNAERDLWNRLLKLKKNGSMATCEAGTFPQSMVWLGALYSPILDDVTALINSMPADARNRQLAEAFLAYRQGDNSAAAQMFDQLDADDPVVQYGTALLLDPRDGQTSAMQKIARDQPGTLVGVLAANAVSQTSELPNSTVLGVKIEQMIRGISRRLWYTDLQQDPWIVLRVNMDEGRYGYLQPMTCHVRVSNNARAPLGIGVGRAMPAEGVLAVTATVNGRQIGRVPPIVFELMDQLRVSMDAPLRTSVRLDRTVLGSLLVDRPELSFNLRITCVLAPNVLDNLAVVPAPTGVARRIHSVFRVGLNATPQLLDRWIQQVDDHTAPNARLRAIARLCKIVPLEDVQQDEQKKAQTIGEMIVIEGEQGRQARRGLTEEQKMLRQLQLRAVNTITRRFEDMSEMDQAWVVRFIPPVSEGETSTYEQVLATAAQSDQPLVRMMYLAAHVQNVDDPSLTSAMQSDQSKIAAFAQARAQALVEQEERREAAEQEAAAQQTDETPTDEEVAPESAEPSQNTSSNGDTETQDEEEQDALPSPHEITAPAPVERP